MMKNFQMIIRRRIIPAVIASISVGTIVVGCTSQNVKEDGISFWKKYFLGEKEEMSYEKASNDISMNVKDLDSIYQEEFGSDVLYITLGGGIGNDDEDVNWNNLNLHDLGWYEDHDEKPLECDCLIQFGNEEGPTSGNYGYSDMSANASIKLRGKRASKRQQKSYRIKIKSGNMN